MRACFTLVELMIVVAIVALLTALAFPMLQASVDRARFAEAGLNYDGIYGAMTAYLVGPDTGGTVNAMWHPSGTIGKAAQAWAGAPAEWAIVGWTPDGDVRCRYTAALNPGPTDGHWIGVECDVDGNGDIWLLDAFPFLDDQGGVFCGPGPSQEQVAGRGRWSQTWAATSCH
jgi:prepilin-type N-terminal cleavage/methylation domain-containing protein